MKIFIILASLVSLSFVNPVFADEVDGVHNCIEVKSNRTCVVRFGNEYRITDRRDEIHEMKECYKDETKSNKKETYFNCRSYYDGGVMPYKGWNYAYFRHLYVDGNYLLVDSGFREKY